MPGPNVKIGSVVKLMRPKAGSTPRADGKLPVRFTSLNGNEPSGLVISGAQARVVAIPEKSPLKAMLQFEPFETMDEIKQGQGHLLVSKPFAIDERFDLVKEETFKAGDVMILQNPFTRICDIPDILKTEGSEAVVDPAYTAFNSVLETAHVSNGLAVRLISFKENTGEATIQIQGRIPHTVVIPSVAWLYLPEDVKEGEGTVFLGNRLLAEVSKRAGEQVVSTLIAKILRQLQSLGTKKWKAMLKRSPASRLGYLLNHICPRHLSSGRQWLKVHRLMSIAGEKGKGIGQKILTDITVEMLRDIASL